MIIIHQGEYQPTSIKGGPPPVVLQCHKPSWNTGELSQPRHHLGWLSLNLVVKNQEFYGATNIEEQLMADGRSDAYFGMGSRIQKKHDLPFGRSIATSSWAIPLSVK